MTTINLNSLDKLNWNSFRFDKITKNVSERVDPTNTDLKIYIGLEHIDAESIHIKRTGTPDQVKGQKLKAYPGDIIFGKRRAYQRKAALVTDEVICSAHAFVLRANPEVIDPALLPFFLHSDMFMHRAVDISVGGLSPTINWGILKSQEFLLPPKEQQAELAKLLWAMDEVIEKDMVLCTAFLVMIETMIEKNLISKSKEGTLSDYCDKDGIKIGPFGSLLHVEDYKSEGIPVVMPSDIIDGEIKEDKIALISQEKANELKNYRLKTNDILFPRRGDLSKRTIVKEHQDGWICGTGTIRVRLRENVNTNIVYYAVISNSVNNWLLGSSVGTTMRNLNAGTIKNIPLKLPEGPLAEKITEEIETSISSSRSVNTKISISKSLQKSLINQVF